MNRLQNENGPVELEATGPVRITGRNRLEFNYSAYRDTIML